MAGRARPCRRARGRERSRPRATPRRRRAPRRGRIPRPRQRRPRSPASRGRPCASPVRSRGRGAASPRAPVPRTPRASQGSVGGGARATPRPAARTRSRSRGPRDGRMADVTLPGTVQLVDDVPLAFARLVTDTVIRSIALSGGETAEACYRALREAPVDWPAVDVFYGDERFVPVDHPDSNEGMTRRALLDHVPVRAIHPMYQPVPIDDAAQAYDALV